MPSIVAPQNWSFRTRLAALIATVFVVSGIALIGVQNLIVHNLLEQQIPTEVGLHLFNADGLDNIPFRPSLDDGRLIIMPPNAIPLSNIFGDVGTVSPMMQLCPPDAVLASRQGGDDSGLVCLSSDGQAIPITSVALQQWADNMVSETAYLTTQQVSANVQRALIGWSALILAVFTLLAVLAAWYLSRSPIRRISAITTTARGITGADLSKRLDLPGPNDEIKQLGDTFDGMLDRIQDAFTRQDRFIAGASHELRTPLTTTRTLLEIPLAQGRVPADLEPAVRSALAANERSEQLIAGLLTIARANRAGNGLVSTSGVSENIESTDLAALTTELLTEKAAELAAKSLTVKLHGAAQASIPQSAALVAISNLIDNAIRYSPANSEIIIQLSPDNGAIFSIANDGADLTNTDVEQLKEPFHRGADSRLATDAHQNASGLGLGLALVDAIALSNGGTLSLAARPTGGLTATLTLPRKK